VKLYLQFGYGMMAHSKLLLKEWSGDGGAILSPRDLERSQLEKVGTDVTGLGAEALVDPQCYSRAADHHRLTEHDYWKVLTKHQTQGLVGGHGADELMDALEDLNASVGCGRRIVPGLLAEEVDSDWLSFQSAFIDAARRRMSAPLLATIAVSAGVLKDENQVETLVEQAESWPVDGFYLVAETPQPYLVGEPVWLANLLILASGLKLLGKYVLVGYCNHQQLGLAAANVDAMASGTYLNVRSFDNGKFFTPEEDQVKKKSTWYYCPHALSEFRAPFLDVAQVKGVLGSMEARSPISGKWGKPLFSGAQPSNVNWREPDAFRHYLDSLKTQCDEATQTSFDDAVAFHRTLLIAGERELGALHSNGVKGSTRDFADYFDVCESAMVLHESARGHRLRQDW